MKMKRYIFFLPVLVILAACQRDTIGHEEYTATDLRNIEASVAANEEYFSYPTLNDNWWISGVSLKEKEKYRNFAPELLVVFVQGMERHESADTVYADWATVIKSHGKIEVKMQPNVSNDPRSVGLRINQGNTGGSLTVTQEP